MRKTILKWLLLTFLLAYVTSVTIWANSEARLHGCKGIVVEIESATAADTVTRHGVLEELSRYPRKIVGTPIETINTKDIVEYLSRLSNFEKVSCVFDTEGMLSVRIVPMIPAVRVFDGNSSYYINKDGKRIESKANFFVDVPVMTGKFSRGFTPKQVLPVVRFVEKDPVLSKVVAMIEARDADNIILVPRIHGHVVNFGDTTRLDEKRQALLTVYHKVIPYKGWEAYDTISVKFQGQVVATRRDKSSGSHGAVYDDDIDPDETTLADIIDPNAE